MKVVHLAYSDLYGGGASVATYRLHRALLSEGIDSELWVARKESTDPTIHEISTAFFSKIRPYVASKLARPFSSKLNIPTSINIFPTQLAKRINQSAADIVHLHWVGAETISIKNIGAIEKPLVWTLHDCWPVSGAFHLPVEGAAGWINRQVFVRKKKHWRNLLPVLVAPSPSILDMLDRVDFFASSEHTLIPHGVDRSVFHPIPKHKARKKLGIENDKLILLFGAWNWSDQNKAYPTLMRALEMLPPDMKAKTHVQGLRELVRGKTFNEQETYRAQAYSAADVCCVPSFFESFGLAILEAAACGCPVVGFRGVGAMDEIIDHGKNGYLATPGDIADFAFGIESCMALSKGDRNPDGFDTYSDKIMASRYIALYNNHCMSCCDIS